MKRSDILKLIERQIMLGVNDGTHVEFVAKDVLDAIEAAGMLPPAEYHTLKNVDGDKVGAQLQMTWEYEEDSE